MKKFLLSSGNRVRVFAFMLVVILSTFSVPVSAASAPVSNYKLTTSKILYCFDNMSTTGKEEKIAKIGNYDTTISHWQGYQKFGTTVILDRNVTSGAGRIVAGTLSGSKTEYTPFSFSKHTGGFQTIGNYLLAPNTDSGNTYISMYQIVSNQLIKKAWSMTINGFEAGSVGITEYESEGISYYVMLLGSTGGYRVYRAIAQSGSEYINLEDAVFSLIGSFSLSSTHDIVEFQGFGLITSTDNKIYVIGPYSESHLTSYKDYLYLYELNTTNWSSLPTKLRKVHLTCKGGAAGAFGVHFRWGTGIQVFQDGFEVYATERNRTTLTGNLMTNYFTARF